LAEGSIVDELPKGWEICKIPEVIFFQEGPGLRKYQYTDSGVPFLNIRTISNGRVDIKLCQFLASQEVKEKYQHFLLDVGDIICSTSGTLGKTAVIQSQDLPLLLNTSVVRFRSLNENVILQKYIHLYLKSQLFLSQALQASTGSAQINVGPSHLKNFDIPLPPLNEQKRIADRLDLLLTRIDKTKAHLDRIPPLLKRFRQSVLAAATSGKLTEDWREANAVDLDDWSYERAADVCGKVQSGGTPREGFIDEAGIPFLKVYNIVDQQVSFEYRPQFILETIHNSSMSKSQAKPGDVLMNIVGPPLGKVAILPKLYPDWNINQAITLFRPSSRMTTGWLYCLLCSGLNIADIVNETRGSAGQSNISLSQCRDFIFPVPPLKEQHEIVRRVETLFAKADRLEAQYQKARQDVDRLTPALLAKAFRGELVPQDPNDEPTSVLLERVKAAKATQAPAKTKRAKKS
jgi:type I restriction enzyme, S subunit